MKTRNAVVATFILLLIVVFLYDKFIVDQPPSPGAVWFYDIAAFVLYFAAYMLFGCVVAQILHILALFAKSSEPRAV